MIWRVLCGLSRNRALRVFWVLHGLFTQDWVRARREVGVVQQRADVELAPATDNTAGMQTDNIHLADDRSA